MEVLPLPGIDRSGFLVTLGRRAFVVDAPLDTDAVTEFIPGWVELAAVVETSVPGHRIAGGRLLAGATGAKLFGPGHEVRGAASLKERTRISDLPGLLSLAAPGYGEPDVALVVEDALFVGDLDGGGHARSDAAAARVTETRRGLAGRFPDHQLYGSRGEARGADLAGMPPVTVRGEPLNFEAVDLTNRGRADMYWADPRIVTDVRQLDADYVRERLGSPWAPAVIDLRLDGDGIEGASHIRPARLASEIAKIQTGREIIVVGDDADIAAAAAGFLARLGMRAAWVRL
jgi:hypothetical protein